MSTGKSRRVPFVVSFGQEDFYLDQDLEKARRTKNRHVITLDGDSVTEDELVSICEARSFDRKPRLVVLDNAQKFKSTKGELARYIEDKNPSDVATVLVAIVRAPQLGNLWTKAAGKGRVAEHQTYKPWERNKTISRVGREAGKLKLKLAPGVADLMLRVTGDNLRQVVSELRKLVHLVGEEGEVTRADVAKIITQVYPAEPFDVAKAAASRNPRKAMTAFSFLYKHMGVGACVVVTASLQRLVEKLLVARQLLDEGVSVDAIAGHLDQRPYPFKKNFLPMVKRHSVTQLLAQMKILCRLEAHVKGGSRSKRTHVELAILSLAA